MVATKTQTKNCWYPRLSCSQPLNMPGNIMPSAMNPVQIAKCAVLCAPRDTYSI